MTKRVAVRADIQLEWKDSEKDGYCCIDCFFFCQSECPKNDEDDYLCGDGYFVMRKVVDVHKILKWGM